MFQLRNWRERFKPGTLFVWRVSLPWGDGMTKVGDPIPPELARRPWQVRELWERHHIGLKPKRGARQRKPVNA